MTNMKCMKAFSNCSAVIPACSCTEHEVKPIAIQPYLTYWIPDKHIRG